VALTGNTASTGGALEPVITAARPQPTDPPGDAAGGWVKVGAGDPGPGATWADSAGGPDQT
jgi:hypothetical protein